MEMLISLGGTPANKPENPCAIQFTYHSST